MPNWCSNYITIEGSKENIQKIKEKLEGVDFSKGGQTGIFETLVGRDPSITEDEFRNGGWYQHNIDRYGCKWDIGQDAEIELYDDKIVIISDTAWSPPINFCKLLQEQYGVKVRCESSEPGNDFAGYYEIDEDGDVDEESYTYMEGLYILNLENFWYEVENNIGYALGDEETYEEFINHDLVNFLPEEELEKVKQMWDTQSEDK
jgi:hypothetical protein